MSQFTRRGAFAGFAGAATALTGTALAATTPPPARVHERRGPSTELLAAIRATQPVPFVHPDARTVWADALLCRSWDQQIYLFVSDDVRGFVQVDARGFALAAAARAGGRPLAAQYWGHEPGWGGVGRFDGALLALDIHDLPVPE